MQATTLNVLRLTGTAGIIAAICWTAGDILLLGNKTDPADYPFLAQYADDPIVSNAAPMVGIASDQLAWGALIAVLTTPLYLAGAYHIYLALKSAGRWLSLPPYLLLLSAMALSPFAHGSFYYVAEMVKLLNVVGTSSHAAIIETATRSTYVLFTEYAILGVLMLASFIWMIVTVALGRSAYPRWVAIANPIVLMVIGSLLDYALPDPLATWISGAGLNIGLLLFFALSTALLWNGGKAAERKNHDLRIAPI